MWINFLSLLPSTLVTVLLITIAFLRFYDQTDFQILGIITEPRIWSNRFTVAAIVATMANFGVEWYRRNRETNRLAQEVQRRVEEKQRRVEEESRRVAQEAADRNRELESRERASRRIRIETRCRLAQIRYQLEPNEANRQELINVIAFLEEYGNTF
ncbi:MAG: hypothetical protein IGQ45_12275 [Cyanobacterium sp. T60_A2020_053]|nr:hypothetical protein [Cyanobacterium sp. T60_A2020_053]